MGKKTVLACQSAVATVALAAFAFLAFEPLAEGHNAGAPLSRIYFGDPFLAYMYASSAPFFAAALRAFRAFGGARRGNAPREILADAARSVAGNLALFSGFAALPVAYLAAVRPGDDIAGGVAVGTFVAASSGAAAFAASRIAKALSRAE